MPQVEPLCLPSKAVEAAEQQGIGCCQWPHPPWAFFHASHPSTLLSLAVTSKPQATGWRGEERPCGKPSFIQACFAQGRHLHRLGHSPLTGPEGLPDSALDITRLRGTETRRWRCGWDSLLPAKAGRVRASIDAMTASCLNRQKCPCFRTILRAEASIAPPILPTLPWRGSQATPWKLAGI